MADSNTPQRLVSDERLLGLIDDARREYEISGSYWTQNELAIDLRDERAAHEQTKRELAARDATIVDLLGQIATRGTYRAGLLRAAEIAWWKPTTTERRNLEKAAALVVAEIERLDRAAIRAEAEKES